MEEVSLKVFLAFIDRRIKEIENQKEQGKGDFDKFVKNSWSQPNIILPVVLLGHIYIELLLNTLLKQTFIMSGRLEEWRSFERKVRIFEALGTIDKKNVTRLITLNTIRNKFAHNLDYRISKDLARKLSSDKKDLDLLKKYPERFMVGEISHIAGYLNSAVSSQRKIKPIKLVDNVELLKLARKMAEKNPKLSKSFDGLFK